jgi:type I restriction enzyme S subunit
LQQVHHPGVNSSWLGPAQSVKLMMSDKIIRLNLSALVDPQYFNLFNNSTISRGYYVTHASGTSSSMKNVSREVILNLPVALPPAVEQSRIVARVQELRGLCASLPDRLTARQTCQAHFAEALVGRAASTAPLAAHTDNLAAAA